MVTNRSPDVRDKCSSVNLGRTEKSPGSVFLLVVAARSLSWNSGGRDSSRGARAVMLPFLWRNAAPPPLGRHRAAKCQSVHTSRDLNEGERGRSSPWWINPGGWREGFPTQTLVGRGGILKISHEGRTSYYFFGLNAFRSSSASSGGPTRCSTESLTSG